MLGFEMRESYISLLPIKCLKLFILFIIILVISLSTSTQHSISKNALRSGSELALKVKEFTIFSVLLTSSSSILNPASPGIFESAAKTA